MLERLFPNDRQFYAAFREVAKRLTAAATLLRDAFDQPARFAELAAGIEAVEREADDLADAAHEGAERMFIPPMDPADIHRLYTRLRRVVDVTGGVARRAVSLRAYGRREPAVRLAGVLSEAARELEAALGRLREADFVLERCRAVKRCEEEGDALWAGALSALFAGEPDPLEVLRWKTLYDQLEEALDACDDVANELETLTVKHTT